MIFNHKVKHNGITYPAGANVPIDNPKVEIQPEAKEEIEVKETPKRKTSTSKKRK